MSSARHLPSSPSNTTSVTSPNNNADAETSTTANTLLLLPPSPTSSSSSLTSDEVIFDHLASIPAQQQDVPSTSGNSNSSSKGKPPILGLRDLVKMHQAEKKAQKAKLSLPSTPVSPGTIMIREELPPAYTAVHCQSSSSGSNAGGISDHAEVFAKQVVIRGWKVVGGKDWRDVAKLGAYVVYDIDISLRNGGNIEILRRYTDFVNLRNALKTKYPSLKDAIPQLPSKAHFSKFSPEFLEQRQPRLQRFLRSVILHPEMGKGGKDSIVGQWIMGKGMCIFPS
ncbi:hypothetical protein I302_102314 [Kwoniella bestiolae CBS 10118]|uniref:Endosomal/vacuolar adapter protein YPT35 n=1 Tax=Kwoniella bestiolae CBS 10118 TaxID=1296100 RepID=A0A1B9GET1_9TREE|nr:hypothetical protein I302_01006 [Kwoniella bestiolae CBS 10118]OCF29499.1 hypothetical protein I302_01006 [Kwoniella bestiolae CBS 10118]